MTQRLGHHLGSAGMGEGYRVELEVYSGPLDLLLQLVRRAEVSLYDIPIAQITDQYLAHLRSLPELDVETAADFLVLAATLLALKARLLLPAIAAPEEDDEAEAEDPRAELVRRLVLYRQYKEASACLAERLAETNRTFDPVTRPAPGPEDPLPEPGCLAGQLPALVRSLRLALAAVAETPPVHRVGPLPVTVGEKMDFIVEVLRLRCSVSFGELFPKGRQRAAVVATFLALLELVRQGLIRVRQEEPLGRLELVRVLPEKGGGEAG